MKPDPEIFHRLLNQFQLKAEQCLFIDDNLDNVKSALDLNFLALHYHNPLSLKHQLRQLGVLGYA
ncbi:MAG: HAD-IA family hydrolase [Bdellovibrionales bacterium]|nr:HAD-IA family hydrolase [Bdellovibrionales bacterium]